MHQKCPRLELLKLGLEILQCVVVESSSLICPDNSNVRLRHIRITGRFLEVFFVQTV